METKETWIKETLESLDRMERAKANPYLYQKVIHRMQNPGVQTVKPAVLRWALATIILLIGINILSVVHQNKRHESYSGSKAFQSEYFSYINNSNL